jgi:hypothetical protein
LGLRGRGDVLVVGEGPLADAAEAGLRLGGCPARRLAAEAISVRRLRGARALVLIDADGLEALLERVAAAGAGAPRVVALADAALASALPAQAPVPVEHIDLASTAARALLVRWPLHLGADPRFGQRPHALIAGRSALGEALLLQILQVGHYDEQGPVVTLLDDDPSGWRAAFSAAYPEAGRFGSVTFRHHDDAWPADMLPVTVAFVTADRPERGLDLAEALRTRLAVHGRVSPPILLEVGDADPGGAVGDWDGQIVPISHRRLVLTPGGLLDRQDDALAQVIHAHYRDSIEAQGRDPATEPAGRPWHQLDEAYRNASRQQADHLWAKLALIDCCAVPEARVDSFAFSPAEVERLAIIEHGRWAADRYLAGWTYAPVRDNVRKHHPQLIPYDALSGPMKDLDRFAVRLVPSLLARSRQGIMRTLILGVAPSTAESARAGARTADRMLTRLSARYPDRALIVATTLGDAFSRCLAAEALARGGGLFVLCPRPLAQTLDAIRETAVRRDLLRLVARAERRISLEGDDALLRWLGVRAEIVICAAAAAAEAEAEVPAKRVRLLPDGGIEWGFEY